MINKILELYARHGKSLLDQGISDAAIPISVAKEALDLFAETKWIVLGGDVYLYQDDTFNNYYADWYCNTTNPTDACNYAKEHIEKLKGDNLFISFTIKN